MPRLPAICLAALLPLLAPAAAPQETDPLDELRDAVFTYLFEGRELHAQALLDETELTDATGELRELRRLVRAADHMEGIVLSGFKPDIGKRVRLRLQNETIVFEPTRTLGERFIYGYVVTMNNGKERRRHQRFVSVELHHSERMRRLKLSDNALAPLLRAVLAWRWGNRKEALASLRHVREENALAAHLHSYMLRSR